MADAKETLNGIVVNSNKQKASDFLQLAKSLYQDLELFVKQDEPDLNIFFLQQMIYETPEPENSLIKSYQDLKVFNEGFGHSNYILELIYKGSRDGFNHTDFHRMCKDKPNNISVVETEHGKIFGGFTSLAWR